MSSILEMITSQLGSGGMRALGSRVGADEATTGKAVAAALPLLLSGLARNASQGSGAEGLAAALDRDHDGSVLDDVSGFLGGYGPGGKQTDGAGILRHVFGAQQERIQNGVGKASGLNASAVASLLATLAPLVMGALGRAKRQQGMDASGLMGLLGQERQGIEARAPREMGILSALLDADGDGDVDLGDIAGGGGLLGKLLGGK